MSIPVYISQSSDYCDENLLPALRAVLLPLIEKIGGANGKKFMLKPNLLSYHRPEDTTCTHPRVIVGCAKILFEQGASKVALIENPGVQDTPFIIKAMGIYDELSAMGVSVDNCARYEQVELPPEAHCRRMELAVEYRDFDAVVNLCKAKTHVMMLITLAVKNLFGLVRGSERLAWHLAAGKSYPRFADMLIDIALTVKPQINLLDAILCMEGNGPGNGETTFRGFLAGAETPFALDAAIAPYLGAEDVPQLKQMKQRGVMPETVLVGEIPECPPLQMPKRDAPLDMSAHMPKFIGNFLRKAMLSYPEVNPKRCIGCGLCAKVCPPETLAIKNKLPHFDLNTCIRCYCCQEHCPQGAITAHRTLSMKIIKRIEKILRKIVGISARIKKHLKGESK